MSISPRHRTFFGSFASVLLGLVGGCGGEAEAVPPASTPTTPMTVAHGNAGVGVNAAASAGPASASLASFENGDEGMWLLNDFPSERLQRLHGFTPTKEWLEHVRLSSVRLARGCSGSVVSADGLVMTNHHCASECVQQLSTKTRDYLAQGFSSLAAKDEVKCPGMEVNQLAAITDVTDRVLAATRGLSERAFFDALKSETAKIEKECATSDAIRCDVVSLYQGGRYNLYRYRRFQDVRLVFAPEMSIAFFGGDPDNFMFPRYDLDLSLVRIYEDGKPAKMDHFFKWSKAGAKEGDLTFVAGHPGRTSRLLTTAQLAFKRDVETPNQLMWLSETRGLLTEYATRGKEEQRTASHLIFGVENALKAIRGRQQALVDKAFFAKATESERTLRNAAEKNPSLSGVAGAWDAIDKSADDARRLYLRYSMFEGRSLSDLFSYARDLVRGTTEITKPNGERLSEYTDGKLPALKSTLFSESPVYDGLETVLLTHALTKYRELFGTDDPAVKALLGNKSPAEVASAAVKGSKLKDKKVRKALFEGGKAAVDASTDPMIALAKLLDPEARAVRKEWEDKVESSFRKYGEQIAKARFAVYGTSLYPDATFSLRLSYGVVRGWKETTGADVKPVTTMGGLFEHATGRDPYALPKTWLVAKDKLNAQTPLDFATTNDIIGGNSGSPVIDKNGEIVGLVFDGNIHSLGGDFGYDADKNRAVAVSSAGIVEALDKVYGMKRVLTELQVP